MDQLESPRQHSDEDREVAKARDMEREGRRRGGLADDYGGQDMSDDEQQINTSTQNRLQMKQRVSAKEKSIYEPHMESQIDPDRAATARHIFEDPAILKEKVLYAQKLREQEKKIEQKGNLEELFDGDEIDD